MKRFILALILLMVGALAFYAARSLIAWSITRAAMLHLYLNGYPTGGVGTPGEPRL